MDETAYTAGTPTDDPELLEQFDGNLEDADASASQVYASASRSFQVARELQSRVKVMFQLLVLVLLTAWLSHPLIENLQSLVAKARRVERRENILFSERWKPGYNWHSECLNNGKATALSPGKRAFGTYALGCAVFDSACYGATIEEIEQGQDEEDIEDLVAFSTKSLEGFAILDGGATKTVSGFMSVQPVADQYQGTTIEMTDVGFSFAGGETEAASTNICIPHAEFPQGISVNVVSRHLHLLSTMKHQLHGTNL